MTTLSFHLPDDIDDTLSRLAKATRRSKSSLALDALREYLARETWQTAPLQNAVTEADAGNIASEEEVAFTLSKWANPAS